MTREKFKKRMKSLKSYRESNPDKGYWDWKVLRFEDGGLSDSESWLDKVLPYVSTWHATKKVFGNLFSSDTQDQTPDQTIINNRSAIKELPSLKLFVEDVWEAENAGNVGLRKDGKYYPHASAEGGAKTIGPGFKLNGRRGNPTVKEANQGMTKDLLDWYAYNIGRTHLDKVNEWLQTGNDYPNVADTVSPQIKQGLMDIRHLVGALGGFPKLKKAVLEGDIAGMHELSKTKFTDTDGRTKLDKRRWNLRKEKFFHYADGGEVPPEEFSEVQQALIDEYHDDLIKAARIGRRPLEPGLQSVFGLSDLPIIDDGTAIYDAGKALLEGNYTAAALAGSAVLPFIPNIANKINKKGFHTKSTAQDAIDWKTLLIEDYTTQIKGFSYNPLKLKNVFEYEVRKAYDRYHATGEIDQWDRSMVMPGGVVHHDFDENVINLWNNSVLSRVDRNLNPDLNIDYLIKKGYNSVDPVSFKKGTSSSDVKGYHTKDDYIVVNSDYDNLRTQGHEGLHSIYDYAGLELNDDLIKYIKSAYDFPESKILYPDNANMFNYDLSVERVTTNFDARNELLGIIHSTKTNKDLLNKIIDLSSDSKIIDAVRKSNGYGRRYIEYLEKNKLLTPEKILAFRNAMKYVPAVVGAAVVTKNINNEQSN